MGVLAAQPTHAPLCASAQGADVPLVVDLDDTLLRTDSLFEALFMFLRRYPQRVYELPLKLLKGRAVLKRFLAERAPPDVAALPYHDELVAHLKAEKQRGRRIILATGADRAIAARVAARLGVFDAVIASDGSDNLTGERKRVRLVAQFGENGFEYIGDGRHRVRLGSYLRALRVHHWLKNLLIFLPIITAHLLSDREQVLNALTAFLAFSLCASTMYLLNDLLDLPFDRAHPQKKSRPLAAGEIRLAHAVLVALALISGAALLALMLPPLFRVVLAGYFVLMVAYSIRLKDIPVVDVLVLACGYASRVIAGYVVAGIAPSGWLLALCIALFTSLAFVKRYTALLTMERIVASRGAHVRGYLPEDKTLIAIQGIASGYLAVLLLALYANSITPLQHQSNMLFWLLCLLLFYWISYMWLVARRGGMHHDPLTFALTDRTSQLVILLATVTGFFAI